VIAIVLLLLAGDEIPFPVERSTILREEGATYFVEGTRRIPWGVEIAVQKEVKIVGRGKDAVLEVEGALQVHGTRDREVIFEHVTIRPAPRFEELRLDMAILRGSGGLRTARDQPSAGKVSVENSMFSDAAAIELALCAGELTIFATHSFEPARIAGLPQAPEKPCAAKVRIDACFNAQNSFQSGFIGGLLLSGLPGATVRNSRMAGAVSEFRDCGALTFDGNKVNSTALAFTHATPGGFKGSRFLKCDVYATTIRFTAPEGKAERVTLDKWWFRGLTKPDEIHEKLIRDGKDDPRNAARVDFAKINDRPLELAGPIDR